MLSPAFDQCLCLLQAVGDLPVQEFISERPIEAFVIAIFPGSPWLDVERLHADPAQPVSGRLSCKLDTIVRPDGLRGSSLREQLRQHGQNVVVPEPSLHMDRQALPPVLVDDCQPAEGSAVMGPIRDEVVRPHMPFMLRSQPHTGTIIEL